LSDDLIQPYAIIMKKLLKFSIGILFFVGGLGAARAQNGTSMYSPIDAGTFSACSSVTSFYDTENNGYGFYDNWGQPSPDIWYKFTIGSSADVSISLCGSNFDTYLHLVDAFGNELTYNDDNGPLCTGLQSSIVYPSLPAGTYYIVAEGYSSTGDIQLSLNVSNMTGGGGTVPGSGMANAINAGTYGSSAGSFTDTQDNSNGCLGNFIGQPSNDIFYKLVLTSPATLSATHCGSALSDTYMHLLDGSGTEITADDDNGPLCTGLQASIVRVLAPGTYYIVSEGYGYNAGDITTHLDVVPTGGDPTDGCTLMAAQLSSDQNYIVTYTPMKELEQVDALKDRSICQVTEDIVYFDGLGRPKQNVAVKASPNQRDIVQTTEYDAYGRTVTGYLPYAEQYSNDGSYKTTALSNQAQYYGSSGWDAYVNKTAFAYSQTVLEPSPLNRLTEQGAPGNDWQPAATPGTTATAGHTVKIAYGTNTDGSNLSHAVRFWLLNSSGNGASWNNIYYPADQLYEISSTDENGHYTLEYKDKQGHVICKKSQGPSGDLETDYIYNDLDQLCYVVPPVPITPGHPYPQSFLETDDVFLHCIYGYHYDARNRLAEKKLPAMGWVFMVYNNLDQLTFGQNANQRGKDNQEWTFMRYDAQGRVVITGIWYSGDGADHNMGSPGRGREAWLADWSQNHAPVFATPDNSTATGYNNDDPPGQVLTISYYDDYSFPGNPYGPWPGAVQSHPTGMLTASMVTVLNHDGTYGPMLWSVNYYDANARVVQQFKQHFLGSSYNTLNYDSYQIVYNFDGQVSNTYRYHYVNGSQALRVDNAYYFDHRGRRYQNYQATNNLAAVLMSQQAYNEVGQVHNKTVGNGLQSTDYTYNERGWLIHSSSGYFDLHLDYNSSTHGAAPQWNGNIAEQEYNKPHSGYQWATYSYDELNRLNNGNSSAGLSETNIGYDNLGNIQNLTRSNQSYTTLAYTYENGGQSNRLSTVSGAGFATRNYTYDDNGNATSDGLGNTINYNILDLPASIPGKGLSYTYDAIGRKLQKVANGVVTEYIDGIQYTGTTIDFVATEEGRAIISGSNVNYEYTLKDNLGNNRVTFDQLNGQVGEDDYYPFGLNMHILQNAGNKYLYNGKEKQEELNDQYDYGARFYDPVIARWTTPDPLAEKNRRWNVYNYVKNNPIRLIDPDKLSTEYHSTFIILV